MSKRVLMSLLAGCLALTSLAACGSDDSGKAAKRKDVTIRVFAAASLTGTFTALGKQFEKEHPGVKVVESSEGVLGQYNTQLTQKIAAMREQLMSSLTSQFDREVEGSLRRIDESIGPYTRFVRAERDHLGAAREELNAVTQGLRALRGRVEGL